MAVGTMGLCWACARMAEMRAGSCRCVMVRWLIPRSREALTGAVGWVCVARAMARSTQAAACQSGLDVVMCRRLKARRRVASLSVTLVAVLESLFAAACW